MIVHNVLPHEPSRLARLLSPIALRVADAVIVHSSAQLMTARSLGARDAVEVVLPLHLSSPSSHVHTRSSAASGRICLVGHVRDYKGLDLLIDALGRSTARPRLEVRGVFWRPPHEFLTRARGQGVGDLVELHDGFASDQDLIDCIDRSDAVVLPYRAATGTQQPRVAFARGVPVIAADVDGLSEQVQDGEDGLLFPAGDVGALARCIDNLYRPATWERLRRGVRRPDPDREWADYLTVLLGRD
jgi:glycosyltransferase involved in cell wall biosynthesis